MTTVMRQTTNNAWFKRSKKSHLPKKTTAGKSKAEYYIPHLDNISEVPESSRLYCCTVTLARPYHHFIFIKNLIDIQNHISFENIKTIWHQIGCSVSIETDDTFEGKIMYGNGNRYVSKLSVN